MNAQQIADLAWAGQHEQAIAAATAALERKALATEDRMTVLDLRSESYIAVGDLVLASSDAKATQNSGSAITSTPSMAAMPALIVSAARRMRSVAST